MILVTGCAGFIGSHLTEELLKRGYEVRGIDSLDDYYSVELKKQNLELLKQCKDFSFLKGDIMDDKLVKDSVKDVSIVFHQAAIAGVRESFKKPLKYMKVNVLATAKLLDASLDVERFIFSSSSSVYGEVAEEELPLKEDMTLKPVSPYGMSKKLCEELCDMYSDFYGLPTVSHRYFTVYGPRQRPDEAFQKFITATLNGGEIEVYGDGNQTRDFTYISDIVEANLLSMKKGSGTYNVGCGSRISVNDVVEVIEEVTGIAPKVSHIERQRGDVMHTLADISKAQRELGYAPNVGLKEGIGKQVEWCRAHSI